MYYSYPVYTLSYCMYLCTNCTLTCTAVYCILQYNLITLCKPSLNDHSLAWPMLTYLETTTFHLPKCFDWLIASLFSRLFLFLVFDAENWLKLYFFLNLSIYYEPWCINTIINFILYWSMSWCWQNYMECSLFLPSPGTARADNSFSRHFYFYLTFFIRICNVYCKYYQLILENKLFLYNFNLK